MQPETQSIFSKHSQEAYDFYFKYATTNMAESSIENHRSELEESALTFALGAFWQSEKRPDSFIDSGCLFLVNGEYYEYSAVVHDSETVYGKKVSSDDRTEYKFSFCDVDKVFWPSNRLTP